MAIGDDKNRYILRIRFVGGSMMDLRLCEPYGQTKKKRNTAIKGEVTQLTGVLKYYRGVDLYHANSKGDLDYIGSKEKDRTGWYKRFEY